VAGDRGVHHRGRGHLEERPGQQVQDCHHKPDEVLQREQEASELSDSLVTHVGDSSQSLRWSHLKKTEGLKNQEIQRKSSKMCQKT
jgi:hypothetical protein